ncbi:hypothetical protein HY251_17060 [bacterium]|nr:hypothetical protein [bacterium]
MRRLVALSRSSFGKDSSGVSTFMPTPRTRTFSPLSFESSARTPPIFFPERKTSFGHLSAVATRPTVSSASLAASPPRRVSGARPSMASSGRKTSER